MIIVTMYAAGVGEGGREEKNVNSRKSFSKNIVVHARYYVIRSNLFFARQPVKTVSLMFLLFTFSHRRVAGSHDGALGALHAARRPRPAVAAALSPHFHRLAGALGRAALDK